MATRNTILGLWALAAIGGTVVSDVQADNRLLDRRRAPAPAEQPAPVPPAIQRPDPATAYPLPTAIFDSFETVPATHELILHGTALAGAEVAVHKSHASCCDELAKATAGADGTLSITIPDVRDGSNAQGFEARVSKDGQLSLCQEYTDFTAHATEIESAAISGIYAEPGSIYGYQITGHAAQGDDIKFFVGPGCGGQDLTRVVSKFNGGGFTAWIDVPPNWHLRDLGFQVTHNGVVTCQRLSAGLGTLDEEILRFEPIARVRHDDASMDVTLSGTAHGRSMDIFLAGSCDGTPVATVEISSALPFPWSATFEWSEWMSHQVAFKLVGTNTPAGVEQRCIVRDRLLDLPLAENNLHSPKARLDNDLGDGLEFSVGVEEIPSDTHYYVNLSYQSDCSQPIFRGAPQANYYVTLPKPVNALYGYTVSEDFQRSTCTKLY